MADQMKRDVTKQPLFFCRMFTTAALKDSSCKLSLQMPTISFMAFNLLVNPNASLLSSLLLFATLTFSLVGSLGIGPFGISFVASVFQIKTTKFTFLNVTPADGFLY